MSEWWKRNKLAQHEATPPDFNIGDRVCKVGLGINAGTGTVEAFSWDGSRIMATVQFFNRLETGPVSSYQRVQANTNL
jgi:hypothetical protein